MLEDYEMIKELGHGSFGRVWEARRKIDGKIVAVKDIDFGTMARNEKRLLVNEVNVLRKLNNPHIVRYVDRRVDRNAQHVFIVMEYCSGGDLQALITRTRGRSKRISEDQIWLTVGELALALTDCHDGEEKVLHRDIKPANIFIDSEGHVKIGDFGLARSLTADFARTRVGTPYYMSPELISGRGYDEKSDIWAFGCVIYEMANLRPAFTGCRMEEELFRKIRTTCAPRIPSMYSDALWRFIESTLEKDPLKRPTAKQILDIRNVRMALKLSGARKALASVRENMLALTAKTASLEKRGQQIASLEERLPETGENACVNVI